MRRRAALLAIVAVALGVRIANLRAIARLPVAEAQVAWSESDMQTAYVWSGRILAGDLLGRDTVHQYTDWMQAIAPLATWEQWWGGRGVFHQAPLYAYVLALVRLIAGDGFWAIGLAQLALGVASVVLVFLLAEHFFGRAAAVAGALGAALYGPFVLFEAFVLRDTLAVTTSLALVLMLTRCDERHRLAWLVAGIAFAVAVLARETTLVFGPFVVLWIAQRLWRRPAALATALVAFGSGAALGLAPLVARNVAVGVAPWALSTRSVESIVYGHAAGASPVGVSLPPATRSILERSEGRLSSAMRLTIESWEGDWRKLVGHEATKLRAVLSGYEAADNVSWYYFADRSPVLRWSIGFEIALALGLVGLCAPGAGGDRRLLVYLMISLLIGLMYGVGVGRYRLVLAAVLWISGGGAIAWLLDAVRHRRWRTAAGIAVAAAGIAAMSAHSLDAVETRQRYRGAEFVIAAKAYYERGQRERSLEELRTGLASAYRGPDQPALPADFRQLVDPFVIVAHELGRDAPIAAELEALLREYPADPDLHRALAAVYRGPLGRPDRADELLAAERRLRGG